MKKLMISLIAILVCVSLLTAPALAGAKQQHRWEGLAIGVGAALLGSALLNSHNNSHNNAVGNETASYETPVPPPPRYCPPRPRGHWEIRRIWVPPTFKRLWNPAHYDHRREWVPGGWIKIISDPGHWTQDRVWVTQ